MTILVIGVNHKTAPIELREKVAFTKEDIEQALPILAAHTEIKEAVIVSTCNRVELYCYGTFQHIAKQWLLNHKNLLVDLPDVQQVQDFSDRCYCYEGIQAVEHLMRVACGLDSLVLGEPEILGQVKFGFAQACLHGAVGPNLSRLFRQVFAVAKKVRTSTKIGACPVSVASTAVGLIQAWLQEDITRPVISELRVLIIGSGDTSSLAAKYVAKLQPKAMVIAGRNQEKVKQLAQETGAKATALLDLASLIIEHDIIISATASDHIIVDASMFDASMLDSSMHNQTKNQLVLDLAVPRDVAANVGDLPLVKLYCVDDLKSVIQQHVNARTHAAQQADNLIAQFSQEFMLSLRALDANEVIKHYRSLLEAQCQEELHKALKHYPDNRQAQTALADFAQNLIKKIMHTPSEQMRLASTEGRQEIIDLAYELFGITATTGTAPSVELGTGK